MNFARFNKISPKVSKIEPKSPFFYVKQPIATQSAFSKKVAFFQLGIGPFWRKLEESGQKWILEPLFSKI